MEFEFFPFHFTFLEKYKVYLFKVTKIEKKEGHVPGVLLEFESATTGGILPSKEISIFSAVFDFIVKNSGMSEEEFLKANHLVYFLEGIPIGFMHGIIIPEKFLDSIKK